MCNKPVNIIMFLFSKFKICEFEFFCTFVSVCVFVCVYVYV